MSQITDFYFPSSAGLCPIHARQWLPDHAPYAGVVQLLHGIAEHIGRYDAFARFLNRHGYIVVGNDHLGHGASISSPENLGYFADRDGWMHVSNDTSTLQIMTERQFPGLPYVLFGHSMGSFLTRTYLIRFPGTVSAAVLCGTGQMRRTTLAAGRAAAAAEALRLGRHGRSPLLSMLAFGSYNRAFRPNRTPFDWLSTSEETVDAYLADPLCGFDITTGLFLDLMDGIAFIRNEANLARMNPATPVYFIAGGLDGVGENGAGVRRAYLSFRKAGMRHLDIRIYPGMRHEILNETARSLVYEDVLSWLQQRRVTQ